MKIADYASQDESVAQAVRLIPLGHIRDIGGLKGFSRSNLYNEQWYGFYAAHGDKVQQLVGQIHWGHIRFPLGGTGGG